jgi:heat shock protein HtpX
MWEQISSNKRRSVALTIGIAAILLLLGYFIGLLFFDNAYAGLIIAAIVWMIMNLVTLFQGDNILLSVSKARKIKKEDHPRLYNIVEEMQIAAGLEKMPDIYIIGAPALNAFATGRDINHASVAITSGLLEKLNRDELQGVIAHEISHIKNRDVLLMVMCGILLGTIVMLSWFASRALIFGGAPRSRSSSGGSGGAIIIVIAIVLMIAAPIAAQMIYFAISRKREYLADASAALYTRYPEGLASALEKLAASTQELRSANNATAPMFIINPFRKKGRAAADLTSTHPPISERIRILRAMSGASFNDYEAAYETAHQGSKRRILPGSALVQPEAVGIREARPEQLEPIKAKVERRRETSEALWQTSNYRTVTCDCGTRLRIPPRLQNSYVRCPHCGRTNPT